jgi:tetratricopeptide (TPR) repeat protein
VGLAKACDDELSCGGALAALIQHPPGPRLARVARPAQLPPLAGMFVGRAADLSTLDAVLDNPTQPGALAVVAVNGPPGIGKTSLALRWAHTIAHRFPDGTLFADLRGHSPEGQPTPPEDLLEGWLRMLGVEPQDIPSALDDRASLLRTVLDGKRMLIMLDNAATTRQVQPLLPASSGCLVIVTSRHRLAGLSVRAGAIGLTVGPFRPDESLELLRGILGVDRVDVDTDAANAIATRCAHWPLAIRVVAVRLAARPFVRLDQTATDLAAPPHLLDALGSEEDVTAVRTVFSWSYRALRAPEARLFRLLGLHPNLGFSLAAAAALAGTGVEYVASELDNLVSAHLVQQTQPDRYRLHDVLHAYAAERATLDESAADQHDARRRILDYYVHTAAAANHVLAPLRRNPSLPVPHATVPDPHFTYGQALAWCETNLDLLVALTALAHELGEDELCWKLPVIMWNYWMLRKHWNAWVTTHTIALTTAENMGDRAGQAWVMNNLANAYRELRRGQEAADLLHEALAIRTTTGDHHGQAWTLTMLGLLGITTSHLDDATQHLTTALNLFVAQQDRHGMQAVIATLGEIANRQGHPRQALDLLNYAFGVAVDLNDPHGQAYAMTRLGDTWRDLRSDQADIHYAVALALRTQLGDRWGQAEIFLRRARTLHDHGHTEPARESWVEALQIYQEVGDDHARAEVQAHLAG